MDFNLRTREYRILILEPGSMGSGLKKWRVYDSDLRNRNIPKNIFSKLPTNHFPLPVSQAKHNSIVE